MLRIAGISKISLQHVSYKHCKEKINQEEIVQIVKEEMNDKILDEFIKKLEEKSHRDEDGIEFWYATQLQEIGGTMPENLPIVENISKVEQKQKKLEKSKNKVKKLDK